MMRRRPQLLLIIIFIVLISAGACTQPKKTDTTSQLPDLPLENDKAVTQTITADKGGWIFYNDAYQEFAVYFPAGSLGKDTEIVMTPIQRLSVGVSGVIDAGFVIEDKATKKSPLLKKPVALAFKMPDSDPNVIIFKYSTKEGVYTPMESRLISSRGSNVLMTGVKSFSAYGVKKPVAKDAKNIIVMADSISIYKGTLTVNTDGMAPLEMKSDTGATTIASKMTLTASCADAVIRGGIYSGECAVSGASVGTDVLSFDLSGSVTMDYLLPSKATDRPKYLPANLKDKVESRAEARGYLELGPSASALAFVVNSPGASTPVEFRPSTDGQTWPFRVFMIPGTDEALVVTAFGFYMGKFESTRAAQ